MKALNSSNITSLINESLMSNFNLFNYFQLRVEDDIPDDEWEKGEKLWLIHRAGIALCRVLPKGHYDFCTIFILQVS